MQAYLDTLRDIYENGTDKEGRNGYTRALFAKQLRFDMRDGFPAITTKKLAFKAVTSELLWFIEGSGDENRLREILGKDTTIWTENAYADYWHPNALYDGDCGRIYGVQWRNWRSPAYPERGRKKEVEIDQLKDVIEKIRKTPNDRRLVVSAWNPGEVALMALPPCHMMFQFFVSGKHLSLHMTQRSCDMFLGVPFNIASYALLLSLVAHVTELEPYECILTLNDAHIYHNHFSAVEEQLTRTPLKRPTLWIDPKIKDIDDFSMDSIALENYDHHEPIKAPMAV